MENMQKSFGAIERERKPEDVLLGSFTPLATHPDVYMPNFTGTIEMQGQTPSCGAHMGQSMKQILESFRGSPEYLWKIIRLADNLPVDSGSNMLTIFDRLAKRGICRFDLLPNNPQVGNIAYADPSTLTPEMDADAVNHKIGPYAFSWNPTFDELKSNIYTHGAVGMLLRVGDEWWVPSWNEQDILPLKSDRPISSGHFVTAFAYDQNYIYFINEWSDKWGRAGIGYFDINYMPRCVEIGTFVNLPAVKYTFTKLLALGSRGYDVKQLQITLNSQGATLVTDEAFGNKTLVAVKAFQTKHGLVADGIVGPKTNAVLNSL